MFKLIEIEDTIRIPPSRFGLPLEEVALEQLRAKYLGIVSEEFGYIVAITNVEVEPRGKLIPGDGAAYHRARVTLLTYKPELQEVVEGEVVEVQEFGAFVRIGPVDALLHISQVMDDFISYDERQGRFVGKETGRVLAAGDIVRTRITAVSIGRGGTSGKIGVTCRQPFMGKLEWIREDVQKLREGGSSG